MTEVELLEAVNQGEAQDWEFKSARGGVPRSMWETYSAMTNTQGGVIVLGVEEKDDIFTVSGVDNVEQKQKNIWDCLNNRQSVSANILASSDVYVREVEGKPVIIMRVPRASRRERPVFTGLNPLEGTYRRNHTGDYKCNREEVGRMLADQSDNPPDSLILPFLTLDHLDQNSVQQYRNRFASRDPNHAWLALPLGEFLERLGAWRRDLRTGEEGITVAGILMFGKDEIIARPEVLPNYHVDYREPSENPVERWADRLWPNGKWVANLFQFLYECLPRLYRGLKVPFQLRELTRIDETPAHVALREAFVNALIHADYSGKGGVVITKTRDRILLENPGTLLVSYEQLQRGGVSECRNKSLQLMFSMLGMSEKAGSGMDRIREGSRYLHSLPFDIRELQDTSRVRMVFPYASMLPEDSVAHLQALYHEGLDALDPEERLALVIAEDEGEVSNLRLQLTSNKHPADLSKLLRGLVVKGFLIADKATRPRCYRISRQETKEKGNASPQLELIAPQLDQKTPQIEGNIPQIGTNTPQIEGNIPQTEENTPQIGTLTPEEVTQLRALAFPEGTSRKVPAEQMMQAAILRICRRRFLTSAQIAVILQRNRKGLRDRYLSPMVEQGSLVLLYPGQRKRKDQAYKTADPNTAGK